MKNWWKNYLFSHQCNHGYLVSHQWTTGDHCLREHKGKKEGVAYFVIEYQGIARTQSPTNKNYAPELPTFGAIARVSPTGVQWKGLALGEPPSRSRYPLCQVSMLYQSPSLPYRHTGLFVLLVCRKTIHMQDTWISRFQYINDSLKQQACNISNILTSLLFKLYLISGHDSPFKLDDHHRLCHRWRCLSGAGQSSMSNNKVLCNHKLTHLQNMNGNVCSLLLVRKWICLELK